jgi:hypothetical protein
VTSEYKSGTSVQVRIPKIKAKEKVKDSSHNL